MSSFISPTSWTLLRSNLEHLLLLFILPASILAVPTDFGREAPPVLSPNTWESILVGLTLIILGSFLTLYGGWRTYPSAFVIGYVVTSTICVLTAWNSEPEIGYNQREALYIAVWIGTGIAGGVLAVLMPPLAVVAACGFAGFVFLGLWFCSLESGGVLKTPVARGLFFSVVTIVPAALSFFLSDLFLNIATAFTGPFLAILGVDLFLRSGLDVGVASFVTFGKEGAMEAQRYTLDTNKEIMLGAVAAFSVLGMVFQWRVMSFYKAMGGKRVTVGGGGGA
ncbi:hypothetical protein HDU76_004393 [Blyttiomyces sp. JEL0837]|nr:hypothetical protein HDU76_004393 [Blyttiomyces sp. JEL0837]